MQDPKIKEGDKYEALRKKGYSQKKAARIANTPDSGKKGGKAEPYEDRTAKELRKQAAKVGISGRAAMKKKEMIRALRSN